MATMNKTFSVKTGLDLANTIILDSNRNLSNVNIANLHTINANSIVTVDGLNVIDQANVARTTANDAYAQANTARDQANTARGTANDAYAQANTARDTANDAYGQANTARNTGNAAYAQANTARATANDAYGEANAAANTVSITVGGLTLNKRKLLLQNTNSMSIDLLDDGVNANLILRSSGGIAYDQANAAYAQANDAYAQANTARGTANDAYAQANTARTTANDAYAQANTGYAQANDAYAQANTARGTANDAYAQANTARTTANDAYAQANTARTTANDAYGQANAAYLQANNAYAEANLKLNLTGGTISGDLDVTGNLYVGGQTTYINVSTYTVEDPLIYLAANNELDDMVDIGFVGGKNAAGVYSHTGLVRHAADDKWYLFDGLAEEGHQNNIIDVANTYLATLRANIEANSILLVGNLVATQANLTLAHDQANAARGQANTAYGQANDAYAQANTARGTANDAYAQANTARGTANDAYAQANAGYSQANAAYGQANAAYGQANLAYAEANVSANTVRVYANNAGSLSNKHLNFNNTASIQVTVTDSGDGKANITFNTTGAAVADAYAQANAGYSQANAAYAQANAGYAQANAAYGQANLAYAQANAAYDEANTKVETIVTGLGLSNSVATVANVVTVTITPNIATTTVIGVTKLVDSITSTDAANAATANAVNWLETKKVDRAGDTMTGKLTINVAGEGLEVANANVTNTLTVEALKVTTNTVTTAASGQVVLDIFPTTELASAKYFVQANSGSTYHTTEIVLVQEGTNIWMTEYGTVQTGASLGTFNADIDSGNVRLLFNATQSINTIRAVRYGIVP